MRDKIKGAILGALVAAFASVLLAQSWTAPRTWTTGDLLTASQFNAQFRDNLLNLRAFSACADTGISGTASDTTVLFGDCRWDSIPATTVVALDMGSTTTTASTYQTAGPTASLEASSGQSISIYVTGELFQSAGCDFRLVNLSTNTEFFTLSSFNDEIASAAFTDASPSVSTANEYALQLRQNTTGTCRFRAIPAPSIFTTDTGSEYSRGMIAVVT